MNQQVERANARGVYRVRCRGPVDPRDGERIVQYVLDHPELHDHPEPNVEAARLLNIPLVDKWDEPIDNVVCTEGKNLALDSFLAGAAYTVVGPFVGLVSSVSYTAVAAGDTGAQINGTNGWKEAGGANAPTYTGNRKTAAWSAAAAGSKALSTALSFAISGTGTLKGAFVLFGTGAVNTKDDAHGTLWSAGLFGTGDRAVLSGDTINVSYSTSL
jgi:hypothetical protein